MPQPQDLGLRETVCCGTDPRAACEGGSPPDAIWPATPSISLSRSWAPLLQKRGLQLLELPAGNFEVATHPGLRVKDSYWRWPERNLAGSAIDFFMRVLGLTFNGVRCQYGKRPASACSPPPKSQTGQRRRRARMPARQCGDKLRCATGNLAKNLTTPLQPFLRCQFDP